MSCGGGVDFASVCVVWLLLYHESVFACGRRLRGRRNQPPGPDRAHLLPGLCRHNTAWRLTPASSLPEELALLLFITLSLLLLNVVSVCLSTLFTRHFDMYQHNRVRRGSRCSSSGAATTRATPAAPHAGAPRPTCTSELQQKSTAVKNETAVSPRGKRCNVCDVSSLLLSALALALVVVLFRTGLDSRVLLTALSPWGRHRKPRFSFTNKR